MSMKKYGGGVWMVSCPILGSNHRWKVMPLVVLELAGELKLKLEAMVFKSIGGEIT